MLAVRHGYGDAIGKLEPHPVRSFDGTNKLGRDLVRSRPSVPRGRSELFGTDAKGHSIAL